MAVSLLVDAFNGSDDTHADDLKLDVKPARPGTASSAADSTTSSLPSAAGPAPRKARSGSTSAAVLGRKANPEKRANHNAIERARRESLNSRFLILAASLPAISEIRRPSKSLIVNRSLQFVADSLAREVLYRDIVKGLHLRNRQLLEQLNEYRANAGHHDQLEQLPPLEPNMPKPLTEVEKDKASSRPKNGISTGTLPPGTAAINNTLAAAAAAAAAAVAAVNADGANDLDEEDDDGFPLPAGGLDGLSMSFGANAGAGSYGSPLSPVDGLSNMEALHHAHLLQQQHQQQQQQQHYLQAAAGYFTGVAAQAPFATAAPAQTAPLAAANGSPASPPELSSGASSGSSPVSSVSSSTGTPALYDMAQPYPVMSAAALAAANAHAAQQHASTSAAGNTRAATAPATSAAVASMAQQMASLYASTHHAHAHQVQPRQTPSGPVPAQHHNNLHYIAAYLQEQAQHQHTLAAAAAAAQAQQHQQHQQQQQNNQTYASLAAQAQARVHALSINTSAAAAAAAPSYLCSGASAPLPSPFLVAPVNGFAA